MSDSVVERRETKRIQYSLEVDLSGLMDGKFETYDIGHFGLFIKATNPPDKGTRFFINFKLPDSPIPIRTFAKVKG